MLCNDTISKSTTNHIQFVDNVAVDTLTFCFKQIMSEMHEKLIDLFLRRCLAVAHFYIEMYKT